MIRKKYGRAVSLTIATILSSSAAMAQDSKLPADPAPIDTVVEQEVARLDENGYIARQSRLGEDILLLGQELQRLQALKTLVEEIGPEAFRRAFPDYADMLADSPLMLQAEIEVVELRRELKDIIEGKAGVEVQAAAPAENPIRDMPSPPVSVSPAETLLRAEAETPFETDAVAAISLRSVYGLGDDLTAVVVFQNERIEVEVGDTVTEGLVVEEITSDSILLMKQGEPFRLFLRG
jgi:hypothetical protein